MYAKNSNEIVDRREMLSIKAKTLAAEARIIKAKTSKAKWRAARKALNKAVEETPQESKDIVLDPKSTEEQREEVSKQLAKKYKEHFKALRAKARKYGPLEHEMYQHRTNVVRLEARATHLAIGMIRGRSIEQMEPVRLKDKRSVAIATMAEEKAQKMVAKYGPVKKTGFEVKVPVAEQVAVSA